MENIKSELREEKQYDWFEVIDKEWNNYELTIWAVKWKFNCETPQDFLNILEITKKILATYIKKAEDNKFYISHTNINWRIYEDLELDDGVLFDTTYLSNKWISKYIWYSNLENYVKFINSLVKSKIVKEWKNINIKNIEQTIKENYKAQVNSLYTKNNLILKKEFENNSFYEIYNKLINWNNAWLLKKLVNGVESWKIEQSVLSAVLLKSLIKNGYKIKEKYDFRNWNNYSENQEFNYFKNLLSKEFKVSFFDQNYNPDVRKLNFLKEWDKINIIWKASDWRQINIWEIQISQFYSNLF